MFLFFYIITSSISIFCFRVYLNIFPFCFRYPKSGGRNQEGCMLLNCPRMKLTPESWLFVKPLIKSQLTRWLQNLWKLYDSISLTFVFQVSLESHFINDLGLDSLDHVEVIMAIEDEFGFEIPDEHAEKLLTPAKIAQYVCDHEKIFS